MSQRFKRLDQDTKITPEFAEEMKRIRKAFEGIEEAVETLGDREKKDQVIKLLEDAYKQSAEVIKGDISQQKKLSLAGNHVMTEHDQAMKAEKEGLLYRARKLKEEKEVEKELKEIKKEDARYRAFQAKKDIGSSNSTAHSSEFPSGHPSQYDKEDPREAPRNLAQAADPHDSFDPHLPRSPADPEDIKKASEKPMKASEDPAKDEKEFGEHLEAQGGRKAAEEGKLKAKPNAEHARESGEKKGEVARQGPGSTTKKELAKASEYQQEHIDAAEKKESQVIEKSPVQKDASKLAK